MEEKNFEHQKEETIYQMVREEPKKAVETFDNKSITMIERPSKKKKWLLVGIVVIIVTFFLLLVFCLFKVYPKYILVKSLDSWTDSLDMFEKPVKNLKQCEFDEMTTKGTGTIQIGEFLLSNLEEEDSTIFQKLNSLSFQIETRIDKKEQKAAIDFNGKLENEPFLDIGYRMEQQKQFIILKDVLETYLELENPQKEVQEIIQTENFQEEIEHVWKVLKRSFKKNLKLSDIKRTPEKILVDGKTVQTTKISLIIDEKNNSKLIKNIIKDLKSDKKAYEFLVKLYPEFEEYEEKVNNYHQISYSVHVTKPFYTIVKVSFVTDENNGISITKGEDDVFEFVKDKNPLFKIIMKEEKNGFKMKLQLVENNLEMTLTGNKEKNVTTYQLDTEVADSSIEVILTHTLTERKKDFYKENAELELKVKAGGIELPIGQINFDLETTKGATFEEIKDSKLITELTEEEKQKIEDYFKNFTKLFEA